MMGAKGTRDRVRGKFDWKERSQPQSRRGAPRPVTPRTGGRTAAVNASSRVIEDDTGLLAQSSPAEALRLCLVPPITIMESTPREEPESSGLFAGRASPPGPGRRGGLVLLLRARRPPGAPEQHRSPPRLQGHDVLAPEVHPWRRHGATTPEPAITTQSPAGRCRRQGALVPPVATFRWGRHPGRCTAARSLLATAGRHGSGPGGAVGL